MLSGGRFAYALAAAAGIGLLVVTLAWSQLSASSAADELVEITSPVVSEEGLAQMRDDITLADSLARGVAADPRAQRVARDDEELARAFAELPDAIELADTVVANLERRLPHFESAASLPGLGLSLHDAAIAQLAIAIVLVVLGLAGVASPRRPIGVAILALGATLVVAPIALGHIDKTDDTDELLDSLRPFSVEKVEARERGLAAARTVFERVPLSSEQEELAEPLLERAGELVAVSATLQGLLVEADTHSARAGLWAFLITGALALISGLFASFARRRPPGAPG